MECATDWIKTLRRASFRGAAFHVDRDSISYGRRVTVHEFPNRDRPYVEDLGEKAISFGVTAYVASDHALGQMSALVSACRRGGPGTLILPTEGSLLVVPYRCDRQFSKDKLGYVAFDLSFHEAGIGFGTFSVALLERLVSVAAEAAVPLIGSNFLSSFSTIGEVPWVVASAASGIRTWLEAIDEKRVTLLGASGTAIAPVTDLARSLGRLHRNAEDLANAGRGAIDAGSHSAEVARESSAPVIVAEMADVMQAVRQSAATPEIAIEVLRDLATYDPVSFVDGEALSTTSAAERANEAAINSMMRSNALLELAVATANASYSTRREAIQARADLAELFERELNSADRDAYAALVEVRGRAAQAISRKVVDLRPTITIEAAASEPSLVWAWRLYRDAQLEGDLAERNRVRHPAFMPAIFEADAPR